MNRTAHTRAVIMLALGAFLWAADARAGYEATMTIDGTATGTFGGTSFTNALVTFAATYDTATITTAYGGLVPPATVPPEYWVAPASVVIEVSGVGSAVFLQGGWVETYSRNTPHVEVPSEMGIFMGANPLNGYYGYGVLGGYGPYNADYDLTTSFGPIGLNYFPPPTYQIGSAPTTAGDFTITSIDYSDWTGQDTVTPAPPSYALAGIASVTLAGYLLRRRRPTTSRATAAESQAER